MIKTRKKAVVVIGANGFLGSKLVRLCFQRGWDVHGIYNTSNQNIPRNCPSYSSKELGNLKLDCDIVFAVASYLPYGNMDTYSEKLFESNVLLPITLIKKFVTSKRLVFISSVSVYGNHSIPITENSPINNPNTYGMSKLIGEFICKFHPNSSIIRFSSLYGTGMKKNTFLPKIIQSAKQKMKITLFGDGSRRQDYIHVEDAAELCCLAGLKGEKGSIYLGVYGKSFSNLEVAHIVQKCVPGCQIEFYGENHAHSAHYNNNRTMKALNFVSKISLEEGIKEMVENDE